MVPSTRRVLLAVALLAAVAAAAFYLGSKSVTHVDSGRADPKLDGGGSIFTADWAYAYGDGVEWLDAEDVWHGEGMPECLPPGPSVENIRFAWTEITVEGVRWRPVVWIDCQSVLAP
jgi:hypothetical protein